MSASRLDAVYRSILITKFFTKGWGKPENLRRLFEFRKVVSNRDECFKLIEKDYAVTITKEQKLSDCTLLEGYFTSPLHRYLPGIVPEVAQKAHFQVLLPVHWPEKGVKPMCLHLAGTGDHEQKLSDCTLLEGYFTSPLHRYLPGIVPEVAQKAHFQVLLPVHWPEKGVKPMCLHLAGTGDHFFWRRRNLMVKPLIKEAGIGGIILENPFYGLRKPVDQVRSSLHNVSDIFVMGGCLILEALVLFHWCERNGLGPLGVTGLSMGGHMASLAATNWPKPLVLVPCLSWSTASAVFLQGVMSQSINWDLLEDQYLSDGAYREKLSKMVTIVDEAFLAGKKFARTYSHQQSPTVDMAPKKVDITYKENNQENPDILDMTKSVEDLNKHLPQKVPKVLPKETLVEELQKLLGEKKISIELYKKLLTDKKFELMPQDIEDINKLSGETINEILMMCKIADLRSTAPQTEPIKKTETKIETKTEPKKPLVKQQTQLVVPKTKPKSKSWSVSEITSDLWSNLPFMRGKEKRIDWTKVHWRDREALQFMRGIMDECTHLSNFSVPFDTSLIIAVCAKHDAYVPRDDVGTLEEIWPGAEVRYVDAGHVSAYILHQSLFRACIKEAFERSKKRWKDGKHID